MTQKTATRERMAWPLGGDAAAGGTAQVPLELLRPNPWDARAARGPEAVRKMADSIAKVGLLQRPLVRLHDAAYEIACGMTRVEAIRLLAGEGKWTGPVPVEVRGLTDAEMAIVALAENRERTDLTPLEQYRAWRRALGEIPELTIQALADGLGLDRSTLSNNLRILQLPAVVLDRVDAGELGAHAAREFLCLMNEDHCHTEDMQAIVEGIAGHHGSSGMPDWRVANVRDCIRDRIWHNEDGWRPLAGPDGDQGYNEGGAMRSPSFDVPAFTKSFPACIHQVPKRDGGARPWTCKVKEWRNWQTQGTRAENKALEQKGEPAKPKTQTEETFQKVLRQDPVAAAARVSKGSPTREQAEALGSRGQFLELKNGSFYQCLDSRSYHQPPAFVDITECVKGCTKGATYGRKYRGDVPRLYCLNRKCWMDRFSVARQKYTDKLKAEIAKQTADDQGLAAVLANQFARSAALALVTAAALLSALPEPRPWVPEGGRDFAYTPWSLTRALELMTGAITDSRGFAVDFGKLAGRVKEETAPELAAVLALYALRCNKLEPAGLVIPPPPGDSPAPAAKAKKGAVK